MTSFLKRFDWVLIGSLVPLFLWSLLILKSVGSADDYFFTRQLIWIGIGVIAMVVVASIDWHTISHSSIVLLLYFSIVALLALLFIGGTRVKGAVSWFMFPVVSFQPAEIAKLVVVLLLAKYFSYRHIDIGRFRHIIVSGVYVLIPTALIMLQPDFGTSMIILVVWFGMILTAGIRIRHMAVLALMGIIVGAAGWLFFLEPYQQQRIVTFLNPTADPRGAGYNAAQSMIAVGSGEIFGKGVGYGSQSRLQFLPESHTDFIFAAFAEEWGFVGILFLFTCLGVFLWRVLSIGMTSPYNFPKLFAVGFSILVMVQVTIHAGMNMGMLPVTGITFPFMSYGGSSLLVFFIGIGILQNIYRHRYVAEAQKYAVDSFN